jgi:hypothetical protein
MIKNFKKELEKIMSNIRWNFVGILDTEKKLHPIPKNIQIQALFEYLGREKIIEWAKKVGIKIIESTNTREYPDLTLLGGPLGKEIIALDIKTGRRDGNRTCFTLGSYWGYFRSPNKKMAGCRLPYGKFTQHWIIGFVYDWDENKDTLHMVSNIETIVQEKWRLASKSTGTGTTTAIGSVKEIRRLKIGNGDFKSKKEFLQYWRNYKRRSFNQ